MNFILIIRIRTDLDDLHQGTMPNFCSTPDLVIDEGVWDQFPVTMLCLVPFMRNC